MPLEPWNDPRILGTAGLAFGLIVGSFLNVVIHRLPRGESVVTPGSHCPGCDQAIEPWNNIPVLSYLLLRGRCARCKVQISIRYPLIEALTGLVFLGVVLHYGPTPMAILGCVFSASLIAAAAIDFDHRIIPDEISLGGLVLGLLLVPLAKSYGGETSWATAFVFSAMGALIGGGLLWIVGFSHARFCSLMGRRFEHWPEEGEDLPRPNSIDYWTWFPGMGFGDIKLLAMIGTFVGPIGVLETILAASLGGLVFGVLAALAIRSWGSPFGFGPAIAVGAILVLLSPVHLLQP